MQTWPLFLTLFPLYLRKREINHAYCCLAHDVIISYLWKVFKYLSDLRCVPVSWWIYHYQIMCMILESDKTVLIQVIDISNLEFWMWTIRNHQTAPHNGNIHAKSQQYCAQPNFAMFQSGILSRAINWQQALFLVYVAVFTPVYRQTLGDNPGRQHSF